MQGRRSHPLKLTINLPAEAQQAMERNQPWTGAVEVSIKPPEAKVRRKAAIADASNGQDVKYILNHWNHYTSSGGDKQGRNRRISQKELDKQEKLTRWCLETIGADEIVKELSKYFEAVASDRHLWSGRNHAYTDLVRFLVAMQKRRKSGSLPWWDSPQKEPTKDSHPKLTMQVADAYAKRFLQREEYGPIKNPSTPYTGFFRAANKVHRTCKGLENEITEGRMIQILMDCMQRNYRDRGETVHPGNLASEYTWTDLMPQMFEGDT